MVGSSEQLAVSLVSGRRIGLDREAIEVGPNPNTETFRDPSPEHRSGEELGAAVDLEVLGCHCGKSTGAAGDMQRHPAEVGVRTMYLDEDRQCVQPIAVTIHPKIGVTIPPRRQQPADGRLGVVDAPESRFGVGPSFGDLDDIGVESDAESERDVLDLGVVCGDLEQRRRNRSRRCQSLGRLAGLPGDAEDASQNVRRPGGNDPKRRAGPDEAVGHVVDDTVAAHGDYRVVSVAGRDRRQRPRLTGMERPHRVDVILLAEDGHDVAKDASGEARG